MTSISSHNALAVVYPLTTRRADPFRREVRRGNDSLADAYTPPVWDGEGKLTSSFFTSVTPGEAMTMLREYLGTTALDVSINDASFKTTTTVEASGNSVVIVTRLFTVEVGGASQLCLRLLGDCAVLVLQRLSHAVMLVLCFILHSRR